MYRQMPHQQSTLSLLTGTSCESEQQDWGSLHLHSILTREGWIRGAAPCKSPKGGSRSSSCSLLLCASHHRAFTKTKGPSVPPYFTLSLLQHLPAPLFSSLIHMPLSLCISSPCSLLPCCYSPHYPPVHPSSGPTQIAALSFCQGNCTGVLEIMTILLAVRGISLLTVTLVPFTEW